MAHKESWDDLRLALVVAEAGSVNAAAKALGLNHATILRRLDGFEGRRGLRLFERSAQGARLLPGAAALLERLRAVEAAVAGFERAAAGLAGGDDGLAGELRLTTTDSLAFAVLPPLVAGFRLRHPGLRVTLAATNARLDLAKLEAELTIRPARTAPEGLVAERVGTMRMRVYGAPDYLASHPSPRAEDHDWLGVSALLARSPAFDFCEALPARRIVARADSFMHLAALARSGLGLAPLPDLVSEGLRPSPDFPELSTGLWVAAHPDLAETPRLRAARRHFAEALAALPEFRDQ